MALDPKRYARARLIDPSHTLPWKGRLFGANAEEAGFETIDLFDPFDQMLIRGGSIALAPAEAVVAAPASAARAPFAHASGD